MVLGLVGAGTVVSVEIGVGVACGTVCIGVEVGTVGGVVVLGVTPLIGGFVESGGVGVGFVMTGGVAVGCATNIFVGAGDGADVGSGVGFGVTVAGGGEALGGVKLNVGRGDARSEMVGIAPGLRAGVGVGVTRLTDLAGADGDVLARVSSSSRKNANAASSSADAMAERASPAPRPKRFVRR